MSLSLAEGLIVQVSPPRQDLHCFGDFENAIGMLGAQVLGHPCGKRGLVVCRFVETDREGPDSLAPVALQDCGDDRGIEAAGEEDSDRDIRDHPVAESIDHERFQLISQLVFAGLPRIQIRTKHAPVGFDLVHAVRSQFQPVSGAKFEDALINGSRLGDITVPEVIGHGRRVEPGSPVPECPQRLEFGTEPKRIPVPAVVKRLDP